MFGGDFSSNDGNYKIDNVWDRYAVQINEKLLKKSNNLRAKVNFSVPHLSEVGTEYVEGKPSQFLHATNRR